MFSFWYVLFTLVWWLPFTLGRLTESWSPCPNIHGDLDGGSIHISTHFERTCLIMAYLLHSSTIELTKEPMFVNIAWHLSPITVVLVCGAGRLPVVQWESHFILQICSSDNNTALWHEISSMFSAQAWTDLR